MKNKIISSIFIAFTALTLSACDFTSSGNSNNTNIPNIDNRVDLKPYEEEEYKTNDQTYYVSDYICFTMEVRGYFQVNIPFNVDKDNENLRIYDNMYFYEGDYFYLISNDYKYIWATLKNEKTEYLTPKREQGEDIQIDVKKSGVYKITLDIKTMVMDFEYKSAIETPYYYPFKNCSIGTLVDKKLVYNDLSVNPDNSDEFMITAFQVETGKLYSFYSGLAHTSNYKITVAEDSRQFVSPSLFETSVAFNVSGEFNIYVNKKTYEVRAQPTNPASLVYDCVVYENKQFVSLTPKDATVPYIFEYLYEATSYLGGYGIVSDDVPKLYNKYYKEYELQVEESELLGNNDGKYYFKKKGEYLLTINLLNLTLKVEVLPE